MARKYNVEAVVYIWDYKGPGHPGHAAMKLHGVPGTTKDKVYISFWPGEGAAKDNAFKKQTSIAETSYFGDKFSEMADRTRNRLLDQTYRPGTGQVAYLKQYDEDGDEVTSWIKWNSTVAEQYEKLDEDQKAMIEFTYVQQPNHKIYIPGKGALGCNYGLDLVAIYEWFQVFMNSPDLQYKFASKKVNCSGVVLTALLKGGAAKLASKPTARLFIDPNQVGDFAKKVATKLEKWNEDSKDVVIPGTAPTFKRSLAVDLPTLAEFKKATKLGKFTGRSHVEKIDTALDQYQKGKLTAQRVELLGNLLKVIREHLMKYPESRRGGGVLALGKDAVEVLRFSIENYRFTEPDWVSDYI